MVVGGGEGCVALGDWEGMVVCGKTFVVLSDGEGMVVVYGEGWCVVVDDE